MDPLGPVSSVLTHFFFWHNTCALLHRPSLLLSKHQKPVSPATCRSLLSTAAPFLWRDCQPSTPAMTSSSAGLTSTDTLSTAHHAQVCMICPRVSVCEDTPEHPPERGMVRNLVTRTFVRNVKRKSSWKIIGAEKGYLFTSTAMQNILCWTPMDGARFPPCDDSTIHFSQRSHQLETMAPSSTLA